MSSHTAENQSLLTDDELTLWRSFLAASVRLTDSLDESLQVDSSLTLTDHEILFSLARAEDKRLRMSDLADEVLVSRSRLTYRINRLTDVGYVERQACDDDRRGLWATLTDQGTAALTAATPSHEANIRQRFVDPIPSQHRQALVEIFAEMEDKLRSQP